MTDHRIHAGAEYRTDDRDSRTYHEGVMAAIHGWPYCPHNGWEYRRQWWAGYNAEQRSQRQKTKPARRRKPDRKYHKTKRYRIQKERAA